MKLKAPEKLYLIDERDCIVEYYYLSHIKSPSEEMKKEYAIYCAKSSHEPIRIWLKKLDRFFYTRQKAQEHLLGYFQRRIKSLKERMKAGSDGGGK